MPTSPKSLERPGIASGRPIRLKAKPWDTSNVGFLETQPCGQVCCQHKGSGQFWTAPQKCHGYPLGISHSDFDKTI